MKIKTVRNPDDGKKWLLIDDPHVTEDGEPTQGYAGRVDDDGLVRGLPGRVLWKFAWISLSFFGSLGATFNLFGWFAYLLGWSPLDHVLALLGHAGWWVGIYCLILLPMPDRWPGWVQRCLGGVILLPLFFLTHGLVF